KPHVTAHGMKPPGKQYAPVLVKMRHGLTTFCRRPLKIFFAISGATYLVPPGGFLLGRLSTSAFARGSPAIVGQQTALFAMAETALAIGRLRTGINCASCMQRTERIRRATGADGLDPGAGAENGYAVSGGNRQCGLRKQRQSDRARTGVCA